MAINVQKSAKRNPSLNVQKSAKRNPALMFKDARSATQP